MKQTKAKAKEAQAMNRTYICFKVTDQDTGQTTYFQKFGWAYKFANRQAGQGKNVRLFGAGTSDWYELYSC